MHRNAELTELNYKQWVYFTEKLSIFIYQMAFKLNLTSTLQWGKIGLWLPKFLSNLKICQNVFQIYEKASNKTW